MRGRKGGGEDNINGNLKRDQRYECNRMGRNMMKMNLEGGGDCVFWRWIYRRELGCECVFFEGVLFMASNSISTNLPPSPPPVSS